MQEEPHFRLSALGMLQLSKYLQGGHHVRGGMILAEKQREREAPGWCSPDDAVQTVDLLVGVGRVSLLLQERSGD